MHPILLHVSVRLAICCGYANQLDCPLIFVVLCVCVCVLFWGVGVGGGHNGKVTLLVISSCTAVLTVPELEPLNFLASCVENGSLYTLVATVMREQAQAQAPMHTMVGGAAPTVSSLFALHMYAVLVNRSLPRDCCHT